MCRALEEPKPGEPTDPKARKTFAEAVEWQKDHELVIAIKMYRKANEQDGGHCPQCLYRAAAIAQEMNDYKTQESILRELISLEQTDAAKAIAHFQLALALQREGIAEKGAKKNVCLNDSCSEFRATLGLDPNVATAHYSLGVTLAHLRQDDAARAEFAEFLNKDSSNLALHQRAAHFVDRIELARSRMAPTFALTTLDGQHITMDGLEGKVVLLDFWATWCGPCRAALPHMREIARKFAGQPLVVLSVSLDDDDAKWKDYIAKNDMTWLQYRDGGFKGPIATRFGVTAIPATFSIDADGVLEDQHVGDENIDGELKKLIARAAELVRQKPAMASSQAGGNQN
jgi:thiol-disulfide isomerase/thioredoxin